MVGIAVDRAAVGAVATGGNARRASHSRPRVTSMRAPPPWRQRAPSAVVAPRVASEAAATAHGARVAAEGVAEAVAEGARARGRDGGGATRSRALAHGVAERAHRAF